MTAPHGAAGGVLGSRQENVPEAIITRATGSKSRDSHFGKGLVNYSKVP